MTYRQYHSPTRTVNAQLAFFFPEFVRISTMNESAFSSFFNAPNCICWPILTHLTETSEPFFRRCNYDVPPEVNSRRLDFTRPKNTGREATILGFLWPPGGSLCLNMDNNKITNSLWPWTPLLSTRYDTITRSYVVSKESTDSVTGSTNSNFKTKYTLTGSLSMEIEQGRSTRSEGLFTTQYFGEVLFQNSDAFIDLSLKF